MHIPFCIYNYYKCITHLIIYLYMCMYMLRLGFAMLPPTLHQKKHHSSGHMSGPKAMDSFQSRKSP